MRPLEDAAVPLRWLETSERLAAAFGNFNKDNGLRQKPIACSDLALTDLDLAVVRSLPFDFLPQ